MWQDVGLYWAWRGVDIHEVRTPTPTKKRLEYARLRYPYWRPDRSDMRICCGVFDDDKYTEKHR